LGSNNKLFLFISWRVSDFQEINTFFIASSIIKFLEVQIQIGLKKHGSAKFGKKLQ